jgi:hypothetical protein
MKRIALEPMKTRPSLTALIAGERRLERCLAAAARTRSRSVRGLGVASAWPSTYDAAYSGYDSA